MGISYNKNAALALDANLAFIETQGLNSHLSQNAELLAQWPSTLVLMMINTHVVMFTNILVFLSFRSLTGY